tara:strand:- start:19928 stop:21139 length:1212 start_codon:yes stop_codon:yes gene_type:complete
MAGNANTPVRLVSQNGKFYNLNCTTLSIDIDRKVNASPMPFMNSYRFTMDLNLTNAIITLEGYITDDDVISFSDGSVAIAYVDFDAVETAIGSNTTATFEDYIDILLDNKTSFSGILNTHSHELNRKHGFVIQDGNGALRTIFFGVISTQYATHSAESDAFIVQIHDGTSSKTNAEIAANLKALVDASIAGATASLQTGEKGNTNTRVQITYSSVPSGSTYVNNNSPYITSATWKTTTPTPKFTTFSGGKSNSSDTGMSAGDMVQQLYAIIDNSNDEWGDNGKSDYIHAVQIPFLSKVAAETGDKYSSRYFFQTAGYDVEDGDYLGEFASASLSATLTNNLLQEGGIYAKGSVPVGTEYSEAWGGRTFTGIKAIVDKATFVQVGGEPNIYQFTIIMMPTNTIL